MVDKKRLKEINKKIIEAAKRDPMLDLAREFHAAGITETDILEAFKAGMSDGRLGIVDSSDALVIRNYLRDIKIGIIKK